MNFIMPSENAIPNLKNEGTNILTNGYRDGQMSVRLYLFSPRSIANTCKRAQKYNFDVSFIEDVKDNVDKLINGSPLGLNVEAQSYMNNYASAAGAVSVDAVGQEMNNKPFEDFWTFILQVDNEQLGGELYKAPTTRSRIVFSGFCLQEPVHTNGITVTINPNCRLKFTHHTSMSKVNINAPTISDIMRVNADVDYILPDISQQLNPNVDSLITPESVCTQSSIDENYTLNTGSKSKLAAYGSSPISTNTVFNSPKHSLKSIVSSVLQTFQDRSLDYVSSGDIRTSNLSNPFGMAGTTDNFRSGFMTNLPTKVADPLVSVDGHDCPTISELQSKYPNMVIEPIAADKLSKDDLADQTRVTPVNLGSSIVVNAVPMLMNDAGMCEIAYRYISYRPSSVFDPNNFGSVGIQDMSETKIFHVATWVAEGDRQTKLRIRNFLGQMQNQIYPILKNIGGEFSLEVSCNSMGECICALRFLDDAGYIDGFYESPLLLGGINSPLVGASEIYDHNAKQMGNLMLSLSMDIGNFIPELPNLFTDLNLPNSAEINQRSMDYANEFFGGQKF